MVTFDKREIFQQLITYTASFRLEKKFLATLRNHSTGAPHIT